MARVYSHSRLSCFENCPKQFHYRYVLRLPAETESIEAFLGKRVHEILERLHQVVQTGRVPSLAAVLRRFHQEWERRFEPERVRIVRREDSVSFYRENGERCLRNHYRRHYPFDNDETLGIEETIRFPLDGDGELQVRGVIDRLVRARDGAIEIHDYKTGRRIPPQSVLDNDRQLAFYQLGLNGRYRDVSEVRLVWHYLLFDQVRRSKRTLEQLETLRESTRALIARIESEREFPAKVGPLCAWCEYAAVCPANPNRPPAEASAAPGAAGGADPRAPSPALPREPAAEPPPGQLPLL